MPAAVALRPDWDAKRGRAAAREVEDADQARRLLAIAAAYEGQDRSAAARIGAMDRQTLRDWVHPLVSGDQLRVKPGLAVARNRQLNPAGVGDHRLLAVAISPIARLLAGQTMV